TRRSRSEDRGRLDRAVQRKRGEQIREVEELGEECGHVLPVRGIDGEPDQRGDRVDVVGRAHRRSAARAATYARQPPYAVISRMPRQSAGSPRTPRISVPSSSGTLPIDSPGGSASRMRATPASGTYQTSTARAAPPSWTRTIAGWRSSIDQSR